MLTEAQETQVLKELLYQTSRSGGKGGQNVNKVETKVTVDLDVQGSSALTDKQKAIILSKYNDLVNGSVIQVSSSTHRSQLENKQDAQKKMLSLLNKLLKPVKKRLATKPSKASKQKKRETKKRTGDKKQLRKKITDY